MNVRLGSALAGTALLALATAPLAAAAPAIPATSPAPLPATASPASAYGYTFEREWTYTSDVTNDVRGVAVSPFDEVFVVGEDQNIRRYDLTGKLAKTWTLPDRSGARVLAVDPRNGQFHVGLWGNIAYDVPSAVAVYTRDGAFVRSYATPADFTWASGIAIDSDGTSYVANSRDDRVHRFSATGEHLGSFGGAGTGNGQFGDQPSDIAIGADGTLFVTDLGNDRVQQFTKTGTFLRAWGQAGLHDGSFMGPTGVAVAPTSGNVFVTDKHSRRVQEFTPTGSFVRTIGQDHLRENAGLSFDRHGALYVAGYLESLVQGVAKFALAAPTGKKTVITAKASKKTYGKKSKVTITVSKKATGTVSVTAGAKTVTGKLKAGKVTVKLPKKALKPGSRTITVSYAGVPGKFRPSSTTAKVRVVKAKPSIKVKAAKKRVKAGKKVSFRITVTAPGVTPGGKVTVKAKNAKAKTVTLNTKGRAKVNLKFSKKAEAGKRTLTVTYRGTSLVKKTTTAKKSTITVRR